MKIKLAVMLALWCASASAQIVGGATPSLSSPGVGGGGMVLVGQGSSVPNSCSPDGVFFFKTTSPIGYQQCVSGSFTTFGVLTLTGVSDNAVLKALANVITASCMSDDGANITTAGCGLIIGSSAAGQVALGQGAAGTCPSGNVCLTVGTGPITAYQLVFPSTAASGPMNFLNSSNVVTGSFLSGTNGNLTSFGANNQLADAGFLASNAVRKDAANTAGASMTLDMSAASVTAGFKAPQGAGAAPTVDGVLSEDTTTHHLKVGSNGSTVDLQTVGGGATGFGTLNGPAVNVQSGTTYTVVAGDTGKIVSLTNGGTTTAVTLPQATGSFGVNFYLWIQNTSVNGPVTITPTTSTINGAATYVLGQKQSVLINSDGTNYQAIGVGGPAASSVAEIRGIGNIIGASGANGDLNFLPSGSSGQFNFETSGGTAKDTISASTGTLSTYQGVATTGNGLNAIMGVINNTSDQTASIGSASLCTTSICKAGFYTIKAMLEQTGTACSSVTAGSVTVTIGWTDNGAAKTLVLPMTRQDGTLSTAGGMAFVTTSNTAFASGQINIWTAGAANITYLTTYVACTTGTGSYRLKLTAEQLI